MTASDSSPHIPLHQAQPLSPHTAKSWQRRPSPVARLSLLVYTLLIIVASLFPFVGWRDMGIPAFAYLAAEWPYRGLRFDIVVNVLGYLPLGLLASFTLYPWLRRIAAVLPATLFCAALSCVMEALQTWLPARVPSKVDLLTNTIGGLCGALFAIVLEKPLLVQGGLRQLRWRWFEADASFGLVLLALWFGALAYPEPFALGIGGIVKPLLDLLLNSFESTPDDALLALGLGSATLFTGSINFVLAEASVCALTLTGAGALLLLLLRRAAPRKRILAAFVVLTLLAKTLAQGLAYGDETSLGWLSEGAFWGLGAGSVLLLALSVLRRRTCAGLGFIALLVGITLNNLIPDNPYYDPLAHEWAYGRFLNFYGLTVGLSYVWPFVVLGYLLLRFLSCEHRLRGQLRHRLQRQLRTTQAL